VRVVLQRVAWARVAVAEEDVAAIGAGLLALVGVAREDTLEVAARLAEKTVRLRLFGDERGSERGLAETGGELLVVSQFTLLADVRRGNRPSWSDAAPPERAAPLVEAYAGRAETLGARVRRGRFGARMSVALENDGPFTLVLESDLPIPPRGGFATCFEPAEQGRNLLS
jgi:D-tyrosyl-tRNA(Tyr) deacylase